MIFHLIKNKMMTVQRTKTWNMKRMRDESICSKWNFLYKSPMNLLLFVLNQTWYRSRSSSLLAFVVGRKNRYSWLAKLLSTTQGRCLLNLISNSFLIISVQHLRIHIHYLCVVCIDLALLVVDKSLFRFFFIIVVHHHHHNNHKISKFNFSLASCFMHSIFR